MWMWDKREEGAAYICWLCPLLPGYLTSTTTLGGASVPPYWKQTCQTTAQESLVDAEHWKQDSSWTSKADGWAGFLTGGGAHGEGQACLVSADVCPPEEYTRETGGKADQP